jgi:hypothetical protein
MATLTVIGGGDQSASFEEHLTEAARRALLAAAEIENDDWAAIIRRFASALPRRAPVKGGGA